MTSKERNERMKYGHDVPRWWIPDFHMTHKNGLKERDHIQSKIISREERNNKEHYELKRRARLIARHQQHNRMNKDIRFLQKATAVLIIVIAAITGGLLGFSIGVCIGLAILALRLEI